MELSSKYDIGDRVYQVVHTGSRKTKKCSTCKGIGRLTILETNGQFDCPVCSGKGKTFGEYVTHWSVERALTIGQVRIEYTDPRHEVSYRSDEPNPEIQYMCVETGVRSGAVYKERDLFATKEEAEAHVREMNDGIESEDVLKDNEEDEDGETEG